MDLGTAATEYQDDVLRNLDSKRIKCDEIWAFCYSKQKNVPDEHVGEYGFGDVSTWTAIDADSKLVPSWLVGERTLADAYPFVDDLRSRLKGRIQLTPDGLRLYMDVVDALMRDRVDYATLHKLYGATHDERTYSPARCQGIEKRVVMGRPHPLLVSTTGPIVRGVARLPALSAAARGRVDLARVWRHSRTWCGSRRPSAPAR